MFTGNDALYSVEQAISKIRADEGQLDYTLRSAIEEAARLRREESQAFRTLARIKLDGLMHDKVIAGLDATEQRALAMIESHRKALEVLSRKRDEAQRRLVEAEATKHKCGQDLAAGVGCARQASPADGRSHQGGHRLEGRPSCGRGGKKDRGKRRPEGFALGD